MNKKIIAVILELLPVLSAPVSFLLIRFNSDPTGVQQTIINITLLLAFLGFAFFFVGRKLAKGDKAVKILGILDWVATLYVVALYGVVIMVFAL